MTQDLIYWYQSLFLQPQHLQLTDRRINRMFQDALKLTRTYPYGFLSLDISESALANGRFQIDHMELLPKDSGGILTVPDNAIAVSRSLPQDIAVNDRLMIYIGLRAEKTGEKGVTVVVNESEETAQVSTRFLTQAEMKLVPDLYGDGPQAEVRFLKAVVKIFLETELDQYNEYNMLPVARIIREGDRFVLDHDYIPPTLTLGAHSSLSNLVKAVTDKTAAKAHQFEIYKNPESSYRSDKLIRFQALATLSQAAIKLENAVSSPLFHPHDAYVLLREIVASLSIFSPTTNFRGRTQVRDDIPAYNHQNIWPTFNALKNLIYTILDSFSSGPRYLLPFVFKEPWLSLDLPDQVLEEGSEFWLIIGVEPGRGAELASDPMKRLKLASRDNITTILSQAIAGLPLNSKVPLPVTLPEMAETVTLKIDHTSPLWIDVRQSKNLSLFWEQAGPTASVKLAVLTGDM